MKKYFTASIFLVAIVAVSFSLSNHVMAQIISNRYLTPYFYDSFFYHSLYYSISPFNAYYAFSLSPSTPFYPFSEKYPIFGCNFLIPSFTFIHLNQNLQKAKNIIFMVPDGMGLANVTAARIFKNGLNGEPLSFERLPVIGYQRTHSANSTVTDSAAAASAWACGEKFINGEISCHSGGECSSEQMPTILEIAKTRGKATGLVVTSAITDATPAAFGSHIKSRSCATEIARQYIEETEVDLLLGGGIGLNIAPCTMSPQDIQALIDKAQNIHGYTYVDTKAEVQAAIITGKKKILGLFTENYKSPERYRVEPWVGYPDTEPTLTEMTGAALDILEEENNGFFLLVEGSQIDWANHGHDVNGQIGETLAFEEAVQVVINWINESPLRKDQTLLIVALDHETGGFAINGPYGEVSQAGDIIQDGWTSSDHTACDTLIWSQGPGSDKLGKALDNTDLFTVMVNIIQ